MSCSLEVSLLINQPCPQEIKENVQSNIKSDSPFSTERTFRSRSVNILSVFLLLLPLLMTTGEGGLEGRRALSTASAEEVNFGPLELLSSPPPLRFGNLTYSTCGVKSENSEMVGTATASRENGAIYIADLSSYSSYSPNHKAKIFSPRGCFIKLVYS